MSIIFAVILIIILIIIIAWKTFWSQWKNLHFKQTKLLQTATQIKKIEKHSESKSIYRQLEEIMKQNLNTNSIERANYIKWRNLVEKFWQTTLDITLWTNYENFCLLFSSNDSTLIDQYILRCENVINCLKQQENTIWIELETEIDTQLYTLGLMLMAEVNDLRKLYEKIMSLLRERKSC